MRKFKLVHVGVAAALAAATATSVGLVQSAVGAGPGTASVLVPIVPCRLLDTRSTPDINVGTRNTPLGSGEAATFAVWGTNGNCTIPNSATGIATNATAVNPTAGSYITIYPADADPRPTASNLNVTAGGSPTPNQVTVGLSASGAIAAFNNTGTVDLVVDIVGYYQAASSSGGGGNDDRYYTKAQVDAYLAGVNSGLATKVTKPTGTRVLNVNPSEFNPSNAYSNNWTISSDSIRLFTATAASVCATAVVDLPDGAVVTQLAAATGDSSPTSDLVMSLYRSVTLSNVGPLDGTMASVSSGTGSQPVDSTITNPTIEIKNFVYVLTLCAKDTTVTLNKAAITYTLP